MKALIYYVDFHPDNYQGGSGKSFQVKTIVNIPVDCLAINVFTFIHEHLNKYKSDRPFQTQECKFMIQKVEIFE